MTLMATHTGVSPEPKMLWVKMMYWMKIVDEVVLSDLDVQDNVDVDVGLRWVEDWDVAVRILHVELPNPDVEDVHVILDSQPGCSL